MQNRKRKNSRKKRSPAGRLEPVNNLPFYSPVSSLQRQIGQMGLQTQRNRALPATCRIAGEVPKARKVTDRRKKQRSPMLTPVNLPLRSLKTAPRLEMPEPSMCHRQTYQFLRDLRDKIWEVSGLDLL